MLFLRKISHKIWCVFLKIFVDRKDRLCYNKPIEK